MGILEKLKGLGGRLLGIRRGVGLNTLRVGRWGESRAAAYLKQEKGMRVLVRNWKQGRDELDLVCLQGEVLVFVEVKTRKSAVAGSGYHAVDRRKKRALRRVCKAYMSQLPKGPRHFRFDIVEVISGSEGQVRIHHFENIKLFSKHYHWQ